MALVDILIHVFTPNKKQLLYDGKLVEVPKILTGERKGFGVTG